MYYTAVLERLIRRKVGENPIGVTTRDENSIKNDLKYDLKFDRKTYLKIELMTKIRPLAYQLELYYNSLNPR